jgi:hypothetical protein
MVAFNRLKDPWSIDKQRAAEQWLRDNYLPPEPVRISWWPLALILAFVLGLMIGR